MYEGAGEILYDTQKKRVRQAMEVFHARGMIAANMLGMPSKVSLVERQVFTITITTPQQLRVPESLRRGEKAITPP